MSSSDAENLSAKLYQSGSADDRHGDDAAGESAKSVGDTDAAVDESDEADSDFVTLQKTLSQKKRAANDCAETRLKKVLPGRYAPNSRPLSISDLESVLALENSAFHNPEFRASREKFEYRLTTCPELSFGIFCTVVPSQAKGWEIETLSAAKPVETDRADGAVSVLLAHAVATMCLGEMITDSDMAVPKDWRNLGGKSVGVGHQKTGRTVALHSLAVAPKLQGCGIGKTIVKAYLQQINNARLADRVAILCQDYLVDYYRRFGFQHKGESKAEFGGGGWHNMVFELSGPPKTPF